MARWPCCRYILPMGAIGIYRDQTSNRAARLTVAHSLALLALLLHITLPAALQMAGPATQTLFETVICAGGENKTIYLDAEGNPAEPASPGTSHDCNSCLHHCGAMLASTLAYVTPGWTLQTIAAPIAYLVASVAARSVQPRAPPAA